MRQLEESIIEMEITGESGMRQRMRTACLTINTTTDDISHQLLVCTFMQQR